MCRVAGEGEHVHVVRLTWLCIALTKPSSHILKNTPNFATFLFFFKRSFKRKNSKLHKMAFSAHILGQCLLCAHTQVALSNNLLNAEVFSNSAYLGARFIIQSVLSTFSKFTQYIKVYSYTLRVLSVVKMYKGVHRKLGV